MPQVYTVDLNSCGTYNLPATATIAEINAISTQYFTQGGTGIITPALMSGSYYNKDNKTWNANGLQNYYTYITNTTNETANETATGTLMNAVVSGADVTAVTTSISIPNISLQQANDTKLSERIKDEYCFYSSRYKAVLEGFLGAMTARSLDTAKAVVLLPVLQDLNIKLNALTTFVNYFTNQRIVSVNIKSAALDKVNKEIQKSIQTNTQADLGSEQSILNTRKEMVRYTKEKNNSISNQISLWAALNIVAIGMIFHLYRTL